MERQDDLPQPEFSRIVSIARLGDDATVYQIAANEGERAALAQRFGLIALDRFAATISLSRESGGGIRLDAEIEAEIVQECVVTLEPFASRVSDKFLLIYRRETAGARDTVDVEEDDFEPLQGNEIDIGEAAAQQLSLALDPFPRAPGSFLPDEVRPGADSAAAPNPFAELANLAKK